MKKKCSMIKVVILLFMVILPLALLIGNQLNNILSGDDEKNMHVINQDSNLILVNKENQLPSNYIPNDLVKVNINFYKTAADEEKHMRKEAAKALEALFNSASKDGIILYGVNGYRSYSTQKALYKEEMQKNGKDYAEEYVAKPGDSEHQTGLAMDVTNKNYSTSFETTKEGRWLAKNCYKFGFIIRYPLNKQETTGYNYEPWHIRFVGIDAAKYIFDKGLVLEEYLKQKNSLPN
ncbi:M15 family metallopeptidase [Clostridium sp. 19966]|uniref:M15 family metallopeptidase n=1 Tax=Clostridium sp. 19966 TaxID=2768166 RepID=UPI0028DE58DB|nr:M15 family metallopeptidase [Clostridium sp. 19966]MDT8716802.1 M15 family metallopeptidase [Clostridium sp. 19966]